MTGEIGIVAGIGYRGSATASDVIAVVRKAMDEFGVDAVVGLAFPGFKPDSDNAPMEAAQSLGLPVTRVEDQALSRVAPRCLSAMRHAMPGAGDKSVAEACALAAAGEGGALLGPRVLGELASCALARGPVRQL
ncbi:MAG: cobalamin biosynthesis protein [Pseudomonadota bacterium]